MPKVQQVELPQIVNESRNQIKDFGSNDDYTGIEAFSHTIEKETKAITKRANACKSSTQHQRGSNVLNTY
jgi:hypothetical protein